MFQSVRHWWHEGSGGRLARLCAFEFMVVVAGVLTAQALANWVSDRSERGAVRAENERIRYEIGRARQNARVWMAAAPCLEGRVEGIIRKASSEEGLNPDELKLPEVIGYTIGPISPDIDRAFRSQYPVAIVDTYGSTSSASTMIVEIYRNVRRDWDRFALMDPDLGPSSAADRATVRDIGVQIRSQLRRLQAQAQSIEQSAARLRIDPLTSGAAVGKAAPIKECSEIWRTGRIWRES